MATIIVVTTPTARACRRASASAPAAPRALPRSESSTGNQAPRAARTRNQTAPAAMQEEAAAKFASLMAQGAR